MKKNKIDCELDRIEKQLDEVIPTALKKICEIKKQLKSIRRELEGRI